MINADMRFYDFYTYGEDDAYGQPQLSTEARGSIKMAINTTSQSIQGSIQYKGATYLGLTLASLDDKYVIQYGEEKLKVLYIMPKGRYKQVFMTEL